MDVSVDAFPDLTGAIRAYIRSLTVVTTMVADRVWIGWPKNADGSLKLKVPPYLAAVLIESGRGGLGPDAEAPYQTERVDISCLGPNEHDANLLWRTLGPYLVDQTRRRPSGFRAANTLVSAVYQEGGPLRSPDPETDWPRTVCSYQFRYCTVPLSELVGV